MRPDSLPIGASAAMPGHLHDLTDAPELPVSAALNGAAPELNPPPWPTPATTVQVTPPSPGRATRRPQTPRPRAARPQDHYRRETVANRTANRLLHDPRRQGEPLAGNAAPQHGQPPVESGTSGHLAHFEYRALAESR
jgi:hypothetical protein